MRIVVCDVGLGNLRSVERALLEAVREGRGGRQAGVEVTNEPGRVVTADMLVMPGQGGFGDCARALSGSLREAVLGHLQSGRPYLGICLGLQVLFGESEEAPGCPGLGVLAGTVRKLAGGADPTTNAPLKIPHMGWNVAEPRPHEGRLRLLDGAQHYYFVHSYVVEPRDSGIVAAITEYGGPFVSAIAYENVFASQFHPEKSQQAGLALLRRFVAS